MLRHFKSITITPKLPIPVSMDVFWCHLLLMSGTAMNIPFPGLPFGIARKVPKDWKISLLGIVCLSKRPTPISICMPVLHPNPKSKHQIKVKNTAFAKTSRNYLGF